MAAAVLITAFQSFCATIVKSNNALNLRLGSSWINSVAPRSTDIARWDSTVTAANSVSLGANLEWLGLKIVNPGGPVALNTGNILTLDGSGADLSVATKDLTLNCNLALNANQSWPVAGGRNLTVGGGISGTALLTLPGPGTFTLNGTTYSLGTSAAGNNALALDGGTLVMTGGTLNLAWNNNNNDGSHIQGGATFKQTGGVVNSSFYTRLGSTGTGTLTVSGGQFNNSGEILMAFAGDNAGGILVVTNTGTVNAHFLRIGNNGPGTVNLDGGLILANRVFSDSGQGYFYFNGGTLQVNGSPSTPWFEETVAVVCVKNGGATIDTAGKNVTLAANVQAYPASTNGLTKTGLGALTLAGTDSYAGPTTISAGALVVNGRHNGSGPFTVNLGATLGGTGVIASPVAVLDGGTIASGPGTLTVGSLTLSGNAATIIGFGAPGAATNGLIQVNGDLTLGGQLIVQDLGSMASNATYTAFYYTGNLTYNGLALSPVSDWQVTLDTSTPHYVTVTTVRKCPLIEIAGGDQAATSLYTNLTAYVHGPCSGKAFWYEVRSNAATGPLTDFGAHAPGSPWPFMARNLRAGTNYILVYAQDGNGSVQSNYVRYTLALGPNTPVRPRPIPAEVWWGGLSDNTQMTNFSEWPFVQQYEDGYFFHSAGWDPTAQGPLMQQLAANLRQFNTKFWPELGGDCPSPSTTWYQGQTNGWGGWAMGCQNNGIIWSEFTHDYHMENMQPVCQVNPAWQNNDQIAWWTGDLTVADGAYPYRSGIWRDTFNGYYLMFPHIKVGQTSSPVWWGWDAYPALYGNNLAFTVPNGSGQNVAYSFTAHEILASFVNMASAISRPYFSFQSDCPWDYFGFNGTLSTGAQNRQKIRTYEQYLQSRGARHTLICNVSNADSQTGGNDAQDLYYLQSSLNNMFTHQREGGRANRYLFESWYFGIPHAVVPETKAGSYCNLALSAIKYIKGIADTNGTFEQLNLTPTATNGTVVHLQLKNNGDVQCLPALAGLGGGVSGVSTRYFTTNGIELTAAILTPEGFGYTNMLASGGAMNLFTVTLAAGLSAATNENASLEAFWNPQDPLGIVRDRQFLAAQLNPLGLWNDADIGSVGLTGGSASGGGSFTLLGSGADIWDTADTFHFVYQTNSGDGTITARVTSQTAADIWSKAGVMIRESTSAGSRHAFVCVTPNNGVNFQNRPVTAGSSSIVGISGPTTPYWVRLMRSGTTFSAYASSDGTNWTQLGGSTNLSGFADDALWGFAVTAHSNTLASAATFDNVAINTPTLALSSVPDQTNLWNQAAPPIPFTIGSATVPASNLVVTASSSNQALLPDGNLALDGADSNRFVTLIPAADQVGSATVTLTASDGIYSASTSFLATFIQPNQPPVLATNADRVIVAGSTLIVTNTATDPDFPLQALTFGLVSAPANASIDPGTGVLTWRPLISQSPLVTSIQVMVSDNGSPVMSATQSFGVVVNKPVEPSLSAAGISNGWFRLTIAGDAGPDYAILGSTNLLDWEPMETNYSATPPFDFADPGATNFSQRFYRVLVGP